MNDNTPIEALNYCVSFIDMLGQRLQFQNEGLLPKYESSEEKKQFNDRVRNTIARVYELQRASDAFMKAALGLKSPVREKLPPDGKRLYDQLNEVHLKQQRWSDGIVYFVSLAEGDVKCPMGGVYTVLLASATMFFVFLAGKLPVRGSIDIAWGAELHEGELYGPAIARAYELESEVAQYPRIVVGPRVVDYLVANIKNPASDIYSKHNCNLAKTCYDILAVDFDGYHIANYLGDGFRQIITKDLHQELYNNSMKFVEEQCKRWQIERNTKLASRYNHLLAYFLDHSKSE